jgi:hypothetical protein
MDDFLKGLTDTLERAREKKRRLQRELEVTDFLIQAQEQALSLYRGDNNGFVLSPSEPKTRARRGDKTGIVIDHIRNNPGIEREPLYEAVKDSGVDRNYLSKVISRSKGKTIRVEAGRHYIMESSNGGENQVV